MNSTVPSNQQGKSSLSPLMIIIMLSLVVLLSLFTYKKWIATPDQQKNQSALILQQEFISTQTDAINTNWLRTLNPLVKNVEGTLVWSNHLQKGVMEFVGLPQIANNQYYQLWIYDLIGKDTKPVFSTKFKQVVSEKFLIPFSASTLINSPFKFELMLSTDGDANSQPLFLAQP